MRQVTGSMANVVRGMDGAMKSMDLEKVRPASLLLCILSWEHGLAPFYSRRSNALPALLDISLRL